MWTVHKPFGTGAEEYIIVGERWDVLQWISEIRPEDHHNHAKKNRMIGSGSWLFKKAEFVNWIESEASSVLWLHGKGTSLSAADHLRQLALT